MVKRSLIRILPITFIGIICLWLLAGNRLEFIETVAELTPFYTTWESFADTVGHPGGSLLYVSSAVSSCFANPWLGSVLFALLACALTMLQSFNHRKGIAPVLFSSAIALLLLLNFTQQCYIIYVLKVPASGTSPLVGFIVVACLVSCAGFLGRKLQSFKGKIVAYIYFAIVVLLGYPLFGFYALFASFLIMMMYVCRLWAYSKISACGFVLVFVALVCLWPYLLATYFYTDVGVPQCYFAALPDYQTVPSERRLWMPIVAAVVLTILFYNIRETQRLRKLFIAVSTLMFITALVVAVRFTYNDKNFSQTLRMRMAVDKADWETVLNIVRQSDSEPTRVEVLFRNLALQKMGRGGDELFQYQDGDAPYNSVRPATYLRLVAAAPLYYYYGKVNFCYRWCMEDMVEYGMRPSYLKYLSLCSIVSGEMKLARKYLLQLSYTWFYRDFAEKYLAYIDNPRLVERDKDMVAVRELMNYDNLLDGDSGLIEVYLLNSFALMEGGTRSMVELSLQDNLILKDIDGFWPRFFALLPTFTGKIPLHYQEAALLFNALQPRYELGQLPIDKQVQESFNELVAASSKNGAMGDDYNATALKPQFGRTYWYYYFFVKELKTN